MYVYKTEILEELARHGLRPGSETPPGQLRDAVRDLYKYEIRRLKERLLAGAFPKQDYAGKVIELRHRYVILSIPTQFWVRNTGE